MSKYLIAGCLALASGLAQAQAYPSKPIKFMIPVASGASSNDILGRVLAKSLAEALGQPVVVENQPGATGTIGSRTVARSAPDGYTLLFGYAGAQTIAPTVLPEIGYDTVKDLAPVAMFSNVPYMLVVHPSVPVSSAKELVAYVKANPGKLSFGSSGTGGVTAFASMVKAGKLRALMVTNTVRSIAAPDVPTAAEAGFPGVIATSWNGVLAPAKTPEAIINRLYTEIDKIANAPDMKSFLLKQGAEPAVLPPAKFGEVIRTEIAQWAKVIKTANIKVE